MFLMLDDIDSFKVSMTTVVEAALNTKKYQLAKMFIQKSKDKTGLRAKFGCGQNLAHVLAKTCESNNNEELTTQVAQALLDAGVSFTSDDNYGCSPLHYACLQCNLALASFILDSCKGIDLEKKDKQGRTALAAAFWNISQHGLSAINMADLLRSRNASVDVLSPYPVRHKLLFRNQMTVDQFEYTDSSSFKPISPLIYAIRTGDLTLVRRIVEMGASVNFSDSEGRTPLMIAVDQNNMNVVRLLLDRDYLPTDGTSDDVDGCNQPRGMPQQQSLFAIGRQKGKTSRPSSSSPRGQQKALLINGIDMSCKIYSNKSGVDLSAVDHRHRHVLHYLVKPTPYGSFDNHKMLIQLHSTGAPNLNLFHELLELMLTRGLRQLSTAFQYLLDKESKSFKQVTIGSPAPVDDGITWNWPMPNFKDDAEQFLSKFEEESAMDVASTGFQVQPDDNLAGPASTWQVMIDNSIDKFCDVLLFKIDVRAPFGMYNFYKMQVVRQKGKDLTILFTRWGRIGDRGQFQQTPFPQLEDAIKEFKKIFRSKTDNDWNAPFQQKQGKYRLVPEEERYFGKEVNDVKLVLPDSKLPSKLHPYLQDVIAELTDVTAYSSTMKKLRINQSLFPLGRISKPKLLAARDILTQLQLLVISVESMKRSMPNTDMTKYVAALEKIAHLSNEYYHLVPRSGFEFESVPILDNSHVLGEEWKNIETLLELEIAAKIMAGALYRVNDVNPLDYVYRCLNCKLQLMDEADVDAQYILCYINATYDGKVEAIYRVSRDGEDERLMTCGVDRNHKLLFHGSSSSNLISILSRGLLIAPPEAPVTGHRFGKGIYTADTFSKSADYCHNYSRHSSVKFMLVCQVALGKSKIVTNSVESFPEEYSSVLAEAKNIPDPQYDITLPTGVVIPLGSQIRGALETLEVDGATYYVWSSDREYIVYRENQVALRYLVQFK